MKGEKGEKGEKWVLTQSTIYYIILYIVRVRVRVRVGAVDGGGEEGEGGVEEG